MFEYTFPPLPLSKWQATRDTLAVYSKVLGKIRAALTPRQKHWWHASLRVGATGLTTTPIPASRTIFELRLDFATHQMIATTWQGKQWRTPLRGQSAAGFCDEVLSALSRLGIEVEIDRAQFSDDAPRAYESQWVKFYWQTLVQLDAVFKAFQGELRQETSPVQVWPHHFDLAMSWFSGRLVPGQDPNNEEYADEQMTFGFSTGDDTIPAPYFYATAYPWPDGLVEAPLPDDADWQTEGFTAAVMLYEALVQADRPVEKLVTFLRTVQQAGASLMR